MPHVSIDNKFKITQSMVSEAIVLAEKGQINPISSKYEDSKLVNAISILEDENTFTKSQKANALKYVISERQKPINVLLHLCKNLHKWLFKKVMIRVVLARK